MSNKISDLTSTQNKPLLVTQQLIEKYYEQILGSPQNIIPILNPKNKSSRLNKDNANVERVEEDIGKRLQTGRNKTTNTVNFNLDTGNEDKLDDDQETVTENENNDIEMVEASEGEDEEQRTSLASKCKSFLYNVFAVSYTHLDVYKRQLMYRTIILFLSNCRGRNQWKYWGRKHFPILRLGCRRSYWSWKVKLCVILIGGIFVATGRGLRRRRLLRFTY